MSPHVELALQRPLSLEDVDDSTKSSPAAVRAFCDEFARQVVRAYLSGDMLWGNADLAMNHVFNFMVNNSGDELPDYAWRVYLAFDEGEHVAPGGDAFTRPRIVAIHAESDA